MLHIGGRGPCQPSIVASHVRICCGYVWECLIVPSRTKVICLRDLVRGDMSPLWGKNIFVGRKWLQQLGQKDDVVHLAYELCDLFALSLFKMQQFSIQGLYRRFDGIARVAARRSAETGKAVPAAIARATFFRPNIHARLPCRPIANSPNALGHATHRSPSARVPPPRICRTQASPASKKPTRTSRRCGPASVYLPALLTLAVHRTGSPT